MADIKDKLVTLESLKTLHDYNKDTYASKEETNELINESIYGTVNVMLSEIVGEVE